jgi:chitin disaccharide deacetylase
MSSHRLVLHADDFGMNRAVSDGIVRGFREGLLTSTSVLSNAPDADRALSLWKGLTAERAAGRLPSSDARRKLDDPECDFDLGVHLNLTQGRPLIGDRYPGELLDSEGRFPSVFALFARLWRSGDKHLAAIRDEWQRQLEFVCDHGFRPTHLNGHQYVEMLPVLTGVVQELLERFAIKTVRVAWEPGVFRNTAMWRFGIAKWPLAQVKRLFAGRFRATVNLWGINHTDAFFGTAHAGSVDLQLLQRFMVSSQDRQTVEIGLHPAEATGTISPEDQADGWNDPLATARPRELKMLTSEELPQLLKSCGWQLGRLQHK